MTRSVLHAVEVENWRFAERVRWAPRDGAVTWLAGRNGAGKSTLLDGLAFLADLFNAPNALDAGLRGHGGAVGVLPFRSLLGDPASPARWEIVADVAGARWRYSLSLDASADGHAVRDERLERLDGDQARPVLEVESGAARWFLGAPGWVPVHPPLGRPLLTQARTSADHPGIVDMASFLRGIWLLRFDPLWMRGSTRSWDPARPLDRHGRDLWSWAEQALAKPGRDAAISGFCEALTWAGLRRGAAGVEFAEVAGKWLEVSRASDGESVLAALALLALFPPDGLHLLLLDEPAVALDVLAAPEVAGWIAEIGDTRQVVAATQALRALDRSTRDRVLLVERIRGAAPKVRPLSEAARERVSGLYPPGATAHELWVREPDDAPE